MTVLPDDLKKHQARRRSAKVNQHTQTSMRDVFVRANNTTLEASEVMMMFRRGDLLALRSRVIGGSQKQRTPYFGGNSA